MRSFAKNSITSVISLAIILESFLRRIVTALPRKPIQIVSGRSQKRGCTLGTSMAMRIQPLLVSIYTLRITTASSYRFNVASSSIHTAIPRNARQKSPAISSKSWLAAKLKCLLQRRHSFDLYDYVHSIFINNDIEVDRSELLRTFLKKTIFEPSPGVAKGLLLDLPFEVFRAIWHKFIVCPRQSLFDLDTAVSRFREHVESLFAGFRFDYYGQIAFYPSGYRNAIMEAANSLKVLDIVYDGQRRLVEPYSLVFKRRKDGFGQEYFYAWDLSGGRSSGPGIKTFLHPKIQALTVTEQSFEPRFSVELGKAGEFSIRSQFAKPFGSSRSRPTTRLRSTRIYIVECVYCGKRFPRKRYSTRLRRHKDRYGNACYGRSGYIAYS